MESSLEQKIAKLLAAMQKVFGTEGSGLRVFAPENENWYDARKISGEYKATTEQANDAIYNYALTRCQQEARRVAGDKEATRAAAQQIFLNEVSLMQPSSGSAKLVISAAKVEELGFTKKDVQTSLELNFKQKSPNDKSLLKAVLEIKGTSTYFYDNRRERILAKLAEGVDYYLTGGKEYKIAYLTPSGQERLPAIVAEELKTYGVAKSPEDKSFREFVLEIKGTSTSFVDSRRERILAKLTEGTDYYLAGGKEHKITYLTPSGQAKLPAIVAKELETYKPHTR